MGLFDTIFGNSEKKRATQRATTTFKALTAYQPVFTSWGGMLYESELVRSAIDARARHISKLKIEMHGSGEKQLQNKIKYRPNSFYTWSQFLYRTSTILDMHNTAFIVPIIDKEGKTSGFFPVLPTSCEMVYAPHTNEFGMPLNDGKVEPWLKYKFGNGETACIERKFCAVLTKFQYQSDFFGDSNTALTPTMDLIDINNQGIKYAVKNSASYRFMAQVSNFTDPDDLKKERQEFSEKNLQGEAEGGLLLFPSTYKDIKQMEQTPYTVDAKQMEQIRTNVYNYFGVNEDVLQNKAYGDSWSAFYEGAIEPFAVQFSEALTNAIYTQNELANDNYVMATSNRLQYLSNTEKYNVSTGLLDRGMINRDEAREIWNLPPLPNGEGQAYIIRGEYKSADDATTAEPTENNEGAE